MCQAVINHYQCIVPPHMLQKIAENGSQDQRTRALESISLSGQFRGQRSAFLEVAPTVIAAQGKSRIVYTANSTTTLPGTIVRQEGQPPSGDAAVDEAYDGAGATYDLYQTAYQRNSIDNNGMRLDSTVHYGKGYDNAFWNGQQMVYGDGDVDLAPDKRIFNRFTIAIDVIGHELTHGVTQYTAGLIYQGQPGALNESISDVFGSLVKQSNLNQTADQADWIIGAGLFTSNIHGVGIRSMKAPGTAYDDPMLGKDPQPANMKDYVNTTSDSGGVHINSGIPNHAFYLVATAIGGYAWQKAGMIWYVALRDKFTKTTDFNQAASLTFDTAGTLFGVGSLEQQAVRKGWADVGLSVDSGGSGSPSCLTSPVQAARAWIAKITG